MNTPKHNNRIIISFTSAILFLSTIVINAQNMKLVWADEFNDAAIDRTIWDFEIGPTSETLHYFTDHSDNAKIVDGKLQIIALKEDYQGFNYTAALLKTQNLFNFRYGRIEASIKLPQTTGFVPGFWMLPQDERYGYWPWSGEIDVMEHPTNQDRIFGTCHSWQYSYFTGSMSPAGGSIQITDSETAFHIYAVEWTPDKIDFFVDDQKYYTFNNENSGFKVWPFDQPFYILLAMGVGGGWAGPPDASTIFPAIMEVDYVRVYQDLKDVSVSGADYIPFYTKGSTYSLPNIDGATYLWNVQGDAQIVSGQNANSIVVDWNTFSGNVEAEITSGDSTYNYEYPVIVSNNFLKNYGFEKGVSPWYQTRPYPGDVEFNLDSENPHNGNNCMYVDVKSQSTNAWDVQLSHRNILLEAGKHYNASFWAKAKSSGTKINAAIINSSTFAPFVIKELILTDIWTKYELNFTSSAAAVGQFNIDMGGHLGSYYFDDFALSLPELNDSNQITNADFSNGNTGWIFNTFAPAQANGEVVNGEFAISISNGGTFLWDIHLGQVNVSCEKEKEYIVSFDAYAVEPRDISAIVGKNSDPWTAYSGNQIISLTTERATYTYAFVMNEPTDNQSRLGFDLGTSTIDLYFDNITLSNGKTPTEIESDNPVLEKSLQLFQNYPNPFNPATKIKYSIPNSEKVLIKVYDVLGEEVKILLDEHKDAGTYEIEFDGSELTSGLYFYKITSGNFSEVRKMILLR